MATTRHILGLQQRLSQQQQQQQLQQQQLKQQQQQQLQQQQQQQQLQQHLQEEQSPIHYVKNSGIIGMNGNPIMDDKEEELSRSALAMFRAKEKEIERKKMEVKDRVQTKLGLAEEATRKLAEIHEELEALTDPMRKDVSMIRKRIDSVNRDLKPLGQTCQRKEREYKEAIEAYNEKNKEKALLVGKLVELVSESEKLRMKKLEELSKGIELSLH